MEDFLKAAGDALIIINSANWLYKFAKWFWKWLQPDNKKSSKKKRKHGKKQSLKSLNFW